MPEHDDSDESLFDVTTMTGRSKHNIKDVPGSERDTTEVDPVAKQDQLRITLDLEDTTSVVEFFEALAKRLRGRKRLVITVE